MKIMTVIFYGSIVTTFCCTSTVVAAVADHRRPVNIRFRSRWDWLDDQVMVESIKKHRRHDSFFSSPSSLRQRHDDQELANGPSISRSTSTYERITKTAGTDSRNTVSTMEPSLKEVFRSLKSRRLQKQDNLSEIVHCSNDTNCVDDDDDNNEVFSHAMQVCHDDAAALELDEEKKYQCSCSIDSMTGVTMNCTSKCGHYCNQGTTAQTRAGDICGREEYDHVYDSSGTTVTRAYHFVYTKGINNRLSIVERDCSRGEDTDPDPDDLICDSCSVTVGTAQICSSCEMVVCEDGSRAPLINCENIEPGASFDLCMREHIPARNGVFSKLTSSDYGSCSDQSPINDICSDESSLVDPGGNSVLGLTSHAIIDDVLSCDGTISSQGLWYRVLGKGTGLTVSTCGSITDFDTQISVYGGNCDSLHCVAFNDDSNEENCKVGQSKISFFGEDGMLYHVRIQGYGTTSGIFELTVREDDLAEAQCMAIKERTESSVPFENGIMCECELEVGGTQSLKCSDRCTFCNDDGTICYSETSFGLFYQNSTLFTKSTTYQFTIGMNHTMKLRQSDCTPKGCSDCVVSVDGVDCNSCSIETCGNLAVQETGLSVDCRNTVTDANFSTCSPVGIHESGVFKPLFHDPTKVCQQDPMDACIILGDEIKEIAGRQRTTCQCSMLSGDDATLVCHDDNCRFCNHEGTACANITYGGTVTGRNPGFDVEFRQYEYVTGRNEVLRYEESKSNIDCSFFIDDKMCASCQREKCEDNFNIYDGISVNCSNIVPGLTFSDCSDNKLEASDEIFKVFSKDEFNQCVEGEDPMDTCMRMKKYEESHGFERNTTCECTSNQISGEAALFCTDAGCLYCDHFATACTTYSYGYRIGSFGEPLSYFYSHLYSNEGEEDDTVLMHYHTDGCVVEVNGQECDSCEWAICADQMLGNPFQNIRVSCENVQDGATFESCNETYVDAGILNVLNDDSFKKCIIPRDAEETCLSEAIKLERQSDDLSCSCSPNHRGGFDLSCIEKGCLYCNPDKHVCGYDTSGTVFNHLGFPVEVTHGFQYISGEQGHILFHLISDPEDPRECLVSFKDQECSSCEIHQCNDGFMGLKIDCTNIQEASYIDQCNFENVTGFLEYLSPRSFLQCTSTMDPMDLCLQQKELEENLTTERGTRCSCRTVSGEIILDCVDSKCIFCNDEESVCKLNSSSGGTISQFGFFTSFVDVSQYIEGRKEEVTIRQTPEGSCSVFIDGGSCSSCTFVVCDDETLDFDIDCSNILEDGIHVGCQFTDATGVFAYLSDDSFNRCRAQDGGFEVQASTCHPTTNFEMGAILSVLILVIVL